MYVLEALKKQVLEIPNKICLSSPEENFTFKELDEYSNYVAKNICLKTNKKIIPLYINNDIFVLPAIIGIMKAGRIPLPMTTSLPLHLSYLRVSEVDFDLIIISEEEKYLSNINFLKLLPKNDVQIDSEFNDDIPMNKIGYIICTSGTTGNPKKVFLSQDNLAWIMGEFVKISNFQNNSRYLFSTPYTFDVSISEMLLPIYTGGELYCFSQILKDTDKLMSVISYVKKYSITHLSVSPSFMELVLQISHIEDLKSLVYLGLGGEAVDVTLATKLLPVIENGTKVMNMYGPSETTIYSTSYELSGHEEAFVPIGKPLNGVDVKVLNESGEAASSGELYISGKGVSLGYLLQKRLSENVFKIIDGVRYYKTGDFVHYDDRNDYLIFDCRKDNQVQINGIRVELGEVENTVSSLIEIKFCRVVYEDQKIFIFYITDFENQKALREKILEVLPRYISPIVIRIDEVVLNQNRKFNSKAVLEKYYYVNNFYKQSSLQKDLNELLSSFNVKMLEELNSLDTVRFFMELEKKYKVKFKDSQIFSYSDIDEIAEEIEKEVNQNQAKVIEENDEVLESNLESSLKVFKKDLEKRVIPTLYHQKTYRLKQYNSLLFFDFKINQIDVNSLSRIKDFFIKLSSDIDSFRFVMYESDTLYFKKIKKDSFHPVVFMSNYMISEEVAKRVLYKNDLSYQFFTILDKTNEIGRCFFTHNIMDKSSLLDVSRRLGYFLKTGIVIEKSNSSYERYIDCIKEKNSNLSLDYILKTIPNNKMLNMERGKRGYQILKSNLLSSSSLNISMEAFYKFSKSVFHQKEIKDVAGAMTANIRILDFYDASNVIGDTHLTIPLKISAYDEYEFFVNESFKMVNNYKKGLNIKDKIYDGYPVFDGKYGVANQLWEELGVIVNYIGEVTDINDTIEHVVHTDFADNYMVVFSNDGNLYQVIFNELFYEDNIQLIIGDTESSLEIHNINI